MLRLLSEHGEVAIFQSYAAFCDARCKCVGTDAISLRPNRHTHLEHALVRPGGELPYPK
jgi:hypothetical protein